MVELDGEGNVIRTIDKPKVSSLRPSEPHPLGDPRQFRERLDAHLLHDLGTAEKTIKVFTSHSSA